MGLMRLLIPVEADVAYLGGGNQGQNSVYHAEPGAEDGDDSQLFAGQHGSHACFHRRLHLLILQRQIAQGLIAHQHDDLLDQGAEFIGSGRLVPENGNLVLDQRVIKDRYIFHRKACLSICYQGCNG